MYSKIAKGLFWIMVIISVAIMVWGSAFSSFVTDGNIGVDVLLRWAYILLLVAIGLVVILGIVLNIINNPKSLIKLGIGILIAAVIVGIAYATAAGTPLLGYLGKQPSEVELKLTDTLLNLVYILGAGAIISIVFGSIVGLIRK